MSREGDATDTGDRPGTPDVLQAAPGFLARRLYQAYQAAWARMVDTTLTGPQYAVLVTVDHHSGGDQGSLASSVALDRSTMADVCRRLEERGLLERTTAPSDGRRKLLRLTDEGRRALHETRARVAELDEELLGRQVDEDERRRLLGELTALSETWESVGSGGSSAVG